MPEKRFRLVDTGALQPMECPCGQTRRAFADAPGGVASMHIVDLKADARTHYHKLTTELYYVLEGEGQIELDGLRVDVHPGSAVMILPECRHRAIGSMRILNVPVPAFDPADEYFD